MTDAMLGADTITAELRRALSAQLTYGQVVELAAGVALFLGFSKIAISLGQAPADMPTMVVPTPDWPATTS